MKLIPFALRNLSVAGSSPSRIEGVLRTSSAVNSHWFVAAGRGDFGEEAAGDDCTSRREDCGLGGDVRDISAGGDGAGGGTSRFRLGDPDGLRSWRAAGGGSV